ncbi:hypothetical protein DFH08DRAFT_878284, partial [Mycena albidolilacea]
MVIVVMICVCVLPSFIWLGVYLIVPGLYANSFLASLNSREKLRAMNDSLPISTWNFAAGLSSGPKSSVG